MSALHSAVNQADPRYYRLVLLVGPPRSGKTKLLQHFAESSGWPRLNLNLFLAQPLLDLTTQQRQLRVADILADWLDTQGASVLLDNLEMLFDPALKVDPLLVLQRLARERTVVASWPGGWDGRTLTYAEPGHPEHRSYDQPDAVVLTVAEALGQAAHLQGTE